jgi:hypothetical protein
MPLAASNNSVRIVLDCQDHTGESAIWDAAGQRLVWVDIGNKRIHRLDPSSGHHETWTTPEFVTSIGLRHDGVAVVSLARRIAFWNFGGAFETFAEPENDRPDNRFNEGKVGPDGCFWVGSMQNNLRDDASERDMSGRHGALHRVEATGKSVRLTPYNIGISNTMAWTSDGRFLFGDTLENVIYQYDWLAHRIRSPTAEHFSRAFRVDCLMARVSMRKAIFGTAVLSAGVASFGSRRMAKSTAYLSYPAVGRQVVRSVAQTLIHSTSRPRASRCRQRISLRTRMKARSWPPMSVFEGLARIFLAELA